MTTAIEEMDTMILECAKLDREINYFVDVMKRATSEVRASQQNNLRTKRSWCQVVGWNARGTNQWY